MQFIKEFGHLDKNGDHILDEVEFLNDMHHSFIIDFINEFSKNSRYIVVSIICEDGIIRRLRGELK